MKYEVCLGSDDYRFIFNNFIDAATLATMMAENGEKSRYAENVDGKGHHYEWHRIEGVFIRVRTEGNE